MTPIVFGLVWICIVAYALLLAQPEGDPHDSP